ncbi:hypothetical protein B566_EDAN010524 [Ephemera danica]|nr:hypothetical protein B566_EDAN010524 [Ephemera danica]
MKRAKLLMSTVLPKPIKLNEEWSKFRSVVLEAKAAGERGFIYFVRTDVKSAFVTVRHQKVLEVLEKHVSSLPAQVQVEERPLNPWVFRKFQRVAIQPKQQDSEESTDSADITPQPSTNQKPPPVQNTSLVAVSRDSAYKTLLQEINNQVIRYGAREFRMCVGLAQGGPLSNHLCNMTLEDMTQKHLSEFTTEDGRSVLWRVADDFLFLTLDDHMARRFQDVTRKGFHSYGWHMNDSKSETNLENQGLTTVSFNGAIFNLASLEAKADFPTCAPDTVLNLISFKQNFNTVEA